MKYVDSKVWLRVTGGGVVGWELLDINGKLMSSIRFHGQAKRISFNGCHGVKMTEMIIRGFLYYGIVN